MIPPGKTRGYARLRFRIHGWDALKAMLASADSSEALATLLANFAGDATSEELVIDLGGPTLMDMWAPKIAEMRAKRTKWTEIVEITGMDLNRAYRAWKRFVDAQQEEDSTSEVDDSSDGSANSDEAA